MKIYKILSKTESKNTLPIFSIDNFENMLITSSTNGDVDLYKDEEVLYKTVKKHNGAVLCVRFNSIGTKIASCGDDGTVIVYDNDLNVLNYFKNHTGDVSNILWTDKYLISVGHDGLVIFYDNKDYKIIIKIKAHESKITGISSNKKNDYICTQGEDGIILYKGHIIYKKIPPNEGVILESFFSRMSWSPDGLLFSSGLSFNQKVNSVEIYNIEMENKFSLLGHVAPCETTAFNPKIFYIEKQFMILAVGSQDLSISLWNTLSPYPFLLIKNASELPILDMKWNDDGTILYFCSYDGSVKKLEFSIQELGNLATKEVKVVNSELFLTLLNAELYDHKIHKLLTQNELTKKAMHVNERKKGLTQNFIRNTEFNNNYQKGKVSNLPGYQSNLDILKNNNIPDYQNNIDSIKNSNADNIKNNNIPGYYSNIDNNYHQSNIEIIKKHSIPSQQSNLDFIKKNSSYIHQSNLDHTKQNMVPSKQSNLEHIKNNNIVTNHSTLDIVNNNPTGFDYNYEMKNNKITPFEQNRSNFINFTNAPSDKLRLDVINTSSSDHARTCSYKDVSYNQESYIENNNAHMHSVEPKIKVLQENLNLTPEKRKSNSDFDKSVKIELNSKRMGCPDGWSERQEPDNFIENKDSANITSTKLKNSEVTNTTKSIKRKKVRPILIDDIEKKDIKSEVLMFNFRQTIKIENGKIEEFYKDFGDYTVELNTDKTFISIKRAKKGFFDIQGSFNFISASKKYIAVYTTNIEIYNLKTGTLICPFIGTSSVIYMDIYKDNLLYLEEDGTLSIFNIKKNNIIQTRIPKYETVIKIKFSKIYFVICEYRDSSYILDKNNKLWYLLRKNWNDRQTTTTDFNNTIDETLTKLENKFLVNFINKRHYKLKRITTKMVNILMDMKLTDNLENKFKKIFIDLINLGHKKFVIKCLEKLSKNFNLQYFVVEIMKKLC